MPSNLADARQIAALVPMARLLRELGFEANERTRRCACTLHGGSNHTAFSWTEAGLWKCHSCGAGGDRISLVRAVWRCSFRRGYRVFGGAGRCGISLAAGVAARVHTERRRERAERAAWRIADEIGRLRRYYTGGLHRVERLQERIGNEILRSSTEGARDAEWERLARLAPVCTFFFAAWNFVWDAKADTLARFALASSTERRQFVLGGVAP